MEKDWIKRKFQMRQQQPQQSRDRPQVNPQERGPPPAQYPTTWISKGHSLQIRLFAQAHSVTCELFPPHYPRWWGSQGHLLSKACKLSSALAAKAYSTAGQAASTLHAMVILQVHQAKGLCTATNVALHLPFGLFGDTVEDFAQQFSAVQNQTEVIKHILPRRDPTKPSCARPSSARHRGCPPAASTPARPTETLKEGTPQQGRRAGHKRVAQPVSQGPPKSTCKTAK
ncbi:WD repeat-containing protein on Y chromosome [Labeo rohita]|uniref:WD repeat-containing protein on Y chromosome n=1 Tax=Labeo rohita TaxID=84645 RepID=A0ABQ8L4T0_LABRO|nr:WD repeat-containing protein on Y chromosome [Labeo rohita]